MDKRMIINADDYGRTHGVSRGIRAAHLNGVVTSTTCMMNMPGIARDLRDAKEESPRLGLGVHLVLSADRPLLPPAEIPTLCDPQGNFLKLADFTTRLPQINPAEVRAEWRAQIAAFVALTGRAPTHLDSHHHSSYFSPALLRAMLEMAGELGCAIRLPINWQGEVHIAGLPSDAHFRMQEAMPGLIEEFQPRFPNAFFDDFYDQQATQTELICLFDSAQNGVCEIMCHPGYNDADLAALSSYASQRADELAALTDPAIAAAIHVRGITLTTFADV